MKGDVCCWLAPENALLPGASLTAEIVHVTVQGYTNLIRAFCALKDCSCPPRLRWPHRYARLL